MPEATGLVLGQQVREPARPPHRLTLALAAVPILVGALGLAGWAARMPALTRWVTPLPVMVPATAVSLLLLGASCAFAARGRGRGAAGAALGGALLALALSATTLLAYAAGATVGPERLFLYDAVRQAGIVPNVILCDIDLPGLSGYDIARTLKAEGSLEETRLIALSGHARADDRRLALDAGFSAHLAKPVSLDELDALLASKS